MDLYIYLTDEQIERVKKFNSSVGYMQLMIATMLAPYDTGNLRRSIRLTQNTSKQIRIDYNDFEANYLHFLEIGAGRVKKYKGFIGETTVAAIMENLVVWLQSGAMIIGNMPINILRTSTNVFSAEKSILKMVGQKDYLINANQRREISKIRSTLHGVEPNKRIGKGIESRVSDPTMKFRSSDTSILKRQYELIRGNRLV